MRQIARVFASIFRARTASAEEIASAERKQHGPCLLCGEELIGHDITQIASVIVGPDETSVSILDSAVRDRAWNDAARFQEWRGDADEVVYSAVRCPWSYQFYITRLESFASMDLDDHVTTRELLSEDESAHLASQLGLVLRNSAS